jgi:hypothetical protein
MLTLRPDSLDWALDHALNFGDTTMFPLPFEYEALRYDWADVRKFLAQQDVQKWIVRLTEQCFRRRLNTDLGLSRN